MIDNFIVQDWRATDLAASLEMKALDGTVMKLAEITVAISSYLGPTRKFLIMFKYPPLFRFYFNAEKPFKFDSIEEAIEYATLQIRKWYKFKAFI